MDTEKKEIGIASPVTEGRGITINLFDFTPKSSRQEGPSRLQITREQYLADRNAKIRGTANPSVMNKPFWIFQAGPEGLDSLDARRTFGDQEDPYGGAQETVWCFKRNGQTRTKLPDGREVCIGGEYEDAREPDFCIYNDVVIFDPPQESDQYTLPLSERIHIYGYPKEWFPPSDYHTSTFYEDPVSGKWFIFIIGGVGYKQQASRDRTDVYRLDLNDFSIYRIETSGVGPAGGTFAHMAELIVEYPELIIRIMRRDEVYKLRIHDMTWI